MMKRILLLLLIVTTLCMIGCKPNNGSTNISLFIDYNIDGQELIFDTLCYQNDAGNHYMIDEIQWFISHIELKNEQGEWIMLNELDDIHYLETPPLDNSPFYWQSIPKDKYTSMRFTFGLDEADNHIGLFPDAPQSNMEWPLYLGGGYHYMKLNGKWLNQEGYLAPLCIHLGIGQNAELTEFYHNHFSVELPFEQAIGQADNCSIVLTMNINNWFRSPHCYDFEVWGSHIMQNQAAQQVLKENGTDVFSVIVKAD